MTPEETRLRELLTLGGVTGAAEPGPQPADALDPIRVWSVWQQFAAEHEGDLQAAYGTVGERFEVSLSRGPLRTTFEYADQRSRKLRGDLGRHVAARVLRRGAHHSPASSSKPTR